jgi:hypothetical protein
MRARAEKAKQCDEWWASMTKVTVTVGNAKVTQGSKLMI